MVFSLAQISISQQALALESNGVIEMPFSDNTPVIDGRWTTQEEWSDASVTNMEAHGNEAVVLVKHDRDYIYIMLDAISDQTPYSRQEGGTHVVYLLFDTENDGLQLRSDDLRFMYGLMYDVNGDPGTYGNGDGLNNVWTGDSAKDREWKEISKPSGFQNSVTLSSKNDPYESSRDHYVHEFKIPISFLHKADSYGFGIIYHMGPFDAPKESRIHVTWPPNLQSSRIPSEWGTLLSPDGSITAPPVPAMSVSEKTVSFGGVQVSEKNSKSITVTNRGTGSLKISGARASGEFSVSGISTPTVVSAGQTTTFQVTFAPLSVGEKTGTLTISSNDLSSPTLSIALSGKATEKGAFPGGGCLIATAAYGTELAPQIQILREIRDHKLSQSQSGVVFMTGFNSIYYSFSPAVADLERQSPVFKEVVKMIVTPMLYTLSILSYADIDSEQEMLGYGAGIILLNLGMYFGVPTIMILRVRSRWTRSTN